LVAILSMVLAFAWTAARGALVPVPPDMAAGTYRFENTGYDGQYYRYLAHDPSLQKGYSRYVDWPQMRFRRLLVPLAAWVLALGQNSWIDPAYIAVEMFFVGLGVYWCSRLLARHGRSPLWGFLFVAVPATLASFDRMLVDGPLTALFAGFLLYCEEEDWTRVWVLAMLAALTRDTGLLLGAALVTDRLLHSDWRRAIWYACSAAPAAVWYAYLAARLPRDGPVAILAAPAWGLLRRLFWFRPYFDPRVQPLIRVTDVLAVLGPKPNASAMRIGVSSTNARHAKKPKHRVTGPKLRSIIHRTAIMLEAVLRKRWQALTPPLLVSLSVSLVFGRPFLDITKGLFSG